MRYAIVSDIHGNLQAWDAVQQDIADLQVDATLCLGDMVGYGPRPQEVVERVWEQATDIVIGNHDGVIPNRVHPEIFNDDPRRMIDWTMDALGPDIPGLLADLPSVLEDDDFTLAHAELADPERYGYIDTVEDIAENFDAGDQPILFVGHSHIPKILAMATATNAIYELPLCDLQLREEQRYIINVGSVGDPRDGRTLASYCLYDSEARRVSHRSVPFDIEAYRADILARRVPIQPWFLMCGDRQTAEAKAIDELSVDIRTIVRPKKKIIVRRLDREIDEAEKARRLEIKQTLERARDARLEQQRHRRETILAARRKREEAEQAAAEEALEKRRERKRENTQLMDESKRREAETAASLAEMIRCQKAEKRRLAAEKAEQIRQRKLALAKAAERRTDEKLRAREEAREAERKRVRKLIALKKQQAAQKRKNL